MYIYSSRIVYCAKIVGNEQKLGLILSCFAKQRLIYLQMPK